VDRMSDTKISLTGWTETYLNPVLSVIEGNEPPDEFNDGFAGFILEGITAVDRILGEDANDWECVELVQHFIESAMKIQERF
jgi:hypothetical protein